MINPYAIVLGLFVVTGILVSIWGLRIIVSARKTESFSVTYGKIEESQLNSDMNDMLPHIEFSYEVDGYSYRQALKFPGDITPTSEFSQSYVEKFPIGSTAKVYYNPAEPKQATLEPGLGQGDWLVFAIGISMVVLGILMFFIA